VKDGAWNERESAGEQSCFFHGKTKLVVPDNDTTVFLTGGFTPLETTWLVTFFFFPKPTLLLGCVGAAMRGPCLLYLKIWP
jgi:S-adenosylmethionine:tRNA-ribosyltransferase-isomerase (queuine synthetase)